MPALGHQLFYVAPVAPFSDGGSGDSSSDSDGGPGFFDGINDNPSEEAFLAATAKKTTPRKRALLGDGFGGEGGGADLGAVDGDGDDHDDSDGDGSETTDPADERASSNGGHTSVASQAGASGKRKWFENRSVRGGDDEADGRTRAGNGGQAAGAGANAGEEGSEDRAAKRKKCVFLEQGAGEKEEEHEEERKEAQEGGKGKGAPPANFSKVDPSLPREELAKRFPLFLEAECRTVEVEAGQMLYLPAGWFHEVR